MAEDRASIDGASVLDNPDERQVEFSAELDGDQYDFALQYAVLEALNGAQIDDADDVLALFERFRDQIEEAAARASARGSSVEETIVVDEGDIQ